MDFPIFHLDWLGNRMLIAVIAILHVLINHALAVGFIPIVTLLEYRGYRARKTSLNESGKWDELARKMMSVGFIITTSLGALTGVGIWLSASLVNPDAIGSLIRVFYGAWFTEWIVFVFEVVFIMIYYLGWKRSTQSTEAKKRHIVFGAALSIFSWLTMAIIVAILGFMMTPGNWLSDRTFLSGALNPLYIPQLYFRTPLAMMMGGSFAMFLSLMFLNKTDPFRSKAICFTSLWTLVWSPVTLVGALLYRTAIPDSMLGNLPTAISTMAFIDWYDSLLWVIFATVIVSILIALWGFLKPHRLPRAALVIPMLALCIFLGSFERIREFIRKPYVIGEYMYANGLRVEEYPLFKKDGILPHATYVSTPEVTEENKLEAGQNVFLIACSRCHTADTSGINSVVRKFRQRTAPGEPLAAQAMKQYIPRMHNVWFYMPPFPGNDVELDALVAFILDLDQNTRTVKGVQDEGLTISPAHYAVPQKNKTKNEGTRP